MLSRGNNLTSREASLGDHIGGRMALHATERGLEGLAGKTHKDLFRSFEHRFYKTLEGQEKTTSRKHAEVEELPAGRCLFPLPLARETSQVTCWRYSSNSAPNFSDSSLRDL